MDRNELQLLPGTKKRLGIKVPGENRFLYIGSAILGAVLITMLYFNNYTNNLMEQVQGLDDQLVALEQTRNKKNEAELKLNKDMLTSVSNLVRNHSYWTQALIWMENMMQREIQIQNISFNGITGDVAITGVAVSYTTVARQIAAFLTDSRVVNLEIGTLEVNSGGEVEFNMRMILDIPNLIKKK